jgi:hypothetical protein
MTGSSTPFQDSFLTTMVGGWVQLRLPEEFDKLFLDEVLIDPRTGTPFEMDGYSAFLALKAIEIKAGASFRQERTRLLDAVIRRLDDVEPPFSHGAFTGSAREVHMRMTAAAVRLLGEAFTEGLLSSLEPLVRAVRYLFSFSDRLSVGTWFLHDSLEVAATGIPYPARRTKNKAWGSSLENNLVLNTHLDTLTTGIHILPLLPVNDASWLTENIESGITALKAVLDTRAFIWRVVSPIDSLARSFIFHTYGRNFRGAYRLRRAIEFILGRFRSRWPSFVMKDGYLERDIGLLDKNYGYHLVNIYDLTRFAHKLRTSVFSYNMELIGKCELIADRGIDYAIDGPYWRYVARTDKMAMLLCEAILSRLSYLSDEVPPQNWIRAYCDVRRRVAPTPALLGYDPLIGRIGGEISAGSQREDLITLVDGRRLKIKPAINSFAWI